MLPTRARDVARSPVRAAANPKSKCTAATSGSSCIATAKLVDRQGVFAAPSEGTRRRQAFLASATRYSASSASVDAAR
jgi:hypothetical protein